MYYYHAIHWQKDTVSQLLPMFQPCYLHCQNPVRCLRFKEESGPVPLTARSELQSWEQAPSNNPPLCSMGLFLTSALLVDDDGIHRVWWVLAHQMRPDSNYGRKSFTVVCKQLVFWSMTVSGARFKKLPQNQ